MSFQKRTFFKVFLSASWFFTLFINHDVLSQAYDIYGLKFASYEVKKDLRSSLDLTPGDHIEVRNSFTVSFDFSYYRSSSAYGYIFRLISDKGVNFDLLSKTSSLLENDLEFVAGSVYTNIHYTLNEIVNNTVKEWIHSIVHFDIDKNEILVSLNGVIKTDTCDLENIKNIRIVFGANSYNKFSTSDVPPVILKNIRIESNGKLKREWKLDQYLQAEVIDKVGNNKAVVLNPVWLIDDHSKWKLKTTLNSQKYSQIAYNGEDSKVFVIEENRMRVVDLSTDSVTTINFKSGRPLLSPSNQLIYNPLKKELWEYVINAPKLARYNFRTNNWDNTDHASNEPAYWHHNKFISPVDQKLMIFGGYGFYTYKNKLFRYNEVSESWESIKFSGFIKPRYLSALGSSTKPDEVLIFGGYGNESGKQELSPESLYDLHSLNLKNYVFTKLWELKNVDVSFAVSNSLIADSVNNCFYTLCYPVHKYATKLFLARFEIANPDMTIISDSIPYLFQDTESFCDLFYNAPTKELIAITSSNKENNLSEVAIYSLSFPPVKAGGYKLKNQLLISKKSTQFIVYSLLVVVLFIAGIILYRKPEILLAYGKKKVKPDILPSKLLEKVDSERIIVSESIDVATGVISSKARKSSIQVLGGFQIFDKNGNEITGLFTPTLKQLFILILLSSGGEGNGVPSEHLKDNIWLNKSKESARNIRGVYIRKLRMILNEIGNVSLLKTNGSWSISIDSDVDYDYGRVQELMLRKKQEAAFNKDVFYELITLGSKGPLLSNMENDWLDKYKEDYSSKIIDVLLDFSKKLDIHKDINMVIQIADSVFKNDPLNEDALKLKCKVLNDNGKHSLAKNVYESFTRDYFISMGSNFEIQFNDLLV